jgi:phosphonopyruvate decarboxylase
VIDGDGSLAMQLGVTAAIGDAAPANLLHIVIDNGIYAISGGQRVPGVRDWTQVALGAGYRGAEACSSGDELQAALRAKLDGPRMVVARCRRERPAYPPNALAGIDPRAEADRLRAALAA